MSRPLLITDCDEVLLHMVTHFRDWLGEAHDVDFAFETGQFAEALTDRRSGDALGADRVWPLLDGFFTEEMHRQTLVPGALEALGRIGEVADIVILTNLGDHAHPWRVDQLASHGIRHQVVCNQGGKGVPARAIVERHNASRAVFVDDLPVHHASVAKHAPEVFRLHMVAEPKLAPVVPPAEHAHARIDDWPTACDWIIERLIP
ncbi:HAD family hydrolase [Sphingomonas sp. HDW15A]|uniref:HAD family hydrolase n=1 Tax=Sphingomonas sp. HDW15A TaxID=2714942 RepID=UPI001408EB36|nr:HAD family hydrolase [Sphingomonas sp. HDW15A]QIK97033.1 HAD family hydrolase [Sphingomonas sp. HDW15A]